MRVLNLIKPERVQSLPLSVCLFCLHQTVRRLNVFIVMRPIFPEIIFRKKEEKRKKNVVGKGMDIKVLCVLMCYKKMMMMMMFVCL